jgi:hypothetical protein
MPTYLIHIRLGNGPTAEPLGEDVIVATSAVAAFRSPRLRLLAASHGHGHNLERLVVTISNAPGEGNMEFSFRWSRLYEDPVIFGHDCERLLSELEHLR